MTRTFGFDVSAENADALAAAKAQTSSARLHFANRGNVFTM
jgi:hypothetical protein